MLKCMSYNKFFKLEKLFRTGVIEVNDTKSRAKFLHVTFSLVFKAIFRLFGTKSRYSLT